MSSVKKNCNHLNSFSIRFPIESYRIAVDHYQCYRCPAGMAFSFVVANVVNTEVDNFLVAFAFAVAADDASSFEFLTIANLEIERKKGIFKFGCH